MKRERRLMARLAAAEVLLEEVRRLGYTTDLVDLIRNRTGLSAEEEIDLAIATFRDFQRRLENLIVYNKPRSPN